MKRIIQKYIYFLILLIPLFGIDEGLGVVGFSFPEAIVFNIKLLRDLMTVVLLLLALVNFIFFCKPTPKILIALSILIVFTLLVVMFSSGSLIIAAGIRWVIPFFLALLLINTMDVAFLAKLSQILFIIVFLNLVLQVYQMFQMPPIRGSLPFNLSARVSGFFALPSVSGSIGAFVYYIISTFSNFNKRKIKFAKVICVLVIVLSMSSTGVGLLFVLLFFPYFLKSKYKFFLTFLFIPLIIVAIYNLDTITGRNEGSSLRSITTRSNILMDQISNSEIISTNFGLATNGAVNLRRKMNFKNDSIIADSIYTSILANYGWLFFIGIILTICFLGIRIFSKSNIELQVFFVLCLLSGVSLVLSEIFPLNILICCLGALYLSQPKGKNLKMIS